MTTAAKFVAPGWVRLKTVTVGDVIRVHARAYTVTSVSGPDEHGFVSVVADGLAVKRPGAGWVWLVESVFDR